MARGYALPPWVWGDRDAIAAGPDGLLADGGPAGHPLAGERARGPLGGAERRALRVSAAAVGRARRLAAHTGAGCAAVFAARLRQPRGVLADAGGAGPLPRQVLDHAEPGHPG